MCEQRRKALSASHERHGSGGHDLGRPDGAGPRPGASRRPFGGAARAARFDEP